MIKQLVMFVDYGVKFQETQDNESVLIALEWLCKMLEKACNIDKEENKKHQHFHKHSKKR
jgi:hypothetical protein